MKKILIGCFACLVAFFGVLFSVCSSNTKLNLLVDNEVSRAAIYENDNIDIYFDNSVNQYNQNGITLEIGTINENSSIYYFNTNNEKILGLELNMFQDKKLIFLPSAKENIFFIDQAAFVVKSNVDNIELGALKDIWYFTEYDTSGNIIGIIEINGFSIEGITLNSNINDINNSLQPYIGNYLPDVSDPDLPPSSPSDNPLNDISNTINGVIDWFVDLFNGLSDIFIVSDIDGNFLGFSLWGNILFIEVSLGLVIIVLRWVISLIKGI